jgi:two-component system, NtrC family, sensor histidine kinase HydH
VADDFFDDLEDLSPSAESDAAVPSSGAEAGLQKLASLVEDLNRDLSTGTILERAMSAAIELTGAERGFLMLLGETGDWDFRVARNMETGDIADAAHAASHTVIQRVLESRRPLLINDVMGGSDLTKQQSIAKMQVRSIMGAPLISKGKLLGAAYVDTSRLAGIFDDTSLVLFESFVQLAVVALENARLIEAEQETAARYRELQLYLNTVLSSQPHGILILDPTLCLEYASPQASRLLGGIPLTPGASFADIHGIGTETLLRVLVDLQDFAQHGLPQHGTLEFGGRTLAYSFFQVPRGHGERIGIILEDITAQKQLERKLIESEKQSTINQLAGGIAHEINNSLQPVKGRVELLELRLKQAGIPLDGGIDKDLATINSLSERIEKIVRNLRHLSKPARPEFEPVDLAQLTRATVELMESTTGTLRGFSTTDPRAAYRLELDLPDYLPPVLGDAHALESALINVILNSCHALHEHGGGLLRLSTAAKGNEAVLVVEDTGGGIAPEILPHVFEPYFTTREGHGGTGLGMCILQNVVEIHGAKLELRSDWGTGTRITLQFPALADAAPHI